MNYPCQGKEKACLPRTVSPQDSQIFPVIRRKTDVSDNFRTVIIGSRNTFNFYNDNTLPIKSPSAAGKSKKRDRTQPEETRKKKRISAGLRDREFPEAGGFCEYRKIPES
jgi:hypothetical protein